MIDFHATTVIQCMLYVEHHQHNLTLFEYMYINICSLVKVGLDEDE